MPAQIPTTDGRRSIELASSIVFGDDGLPLLRDGPQHRELNLMLRAPENLLGLKLIADLSEEIPVGADEPRAEPCIMIPVYTVGEPRAAHGPVSSRRVPRPARPP